MNTLIRVLSVFLLVIISVWGGNAQATIQDCLGAVPVCQQVYVEENSPSGTGTFPMEISPGQTCVDAEINSIWYVFTANEDGELGFLITPNDLNDDYDWILCNITNAQCEDIGNDPSIVVSCNAAGGFGCNGLTGCTGDTNENVQGAGCAFGNTPFNALVPMQEGETYVLMVSNWTGSTNGYTLDFGASSGIGIFDETSPQQESILTPESCGEDLITVWFNEFIQCSTISADNFVLTGPGGPYTLSINSDCDDGEDRSKLFFLTCDPPISSMGDFQLELVNDDLDEVLDLCDNPTAPYVYEFTVDVPVPIDVNISGDTTFLCNGEGVVLDVTTEGGVYEWSNGSTEGMITATNEGVYSVTVNDICGFGADTTQVVIVYEPPVVDLGEDQTLCPEETLLLEDNNIHTTYEWQDGSTNNTYEVSTVGVYTLEATNACGITVDDIAIDYYDALDFAFPADTVLCIGDTLVFNITNPSATSYIWNTGHTSPYIEISSAGYYEVTVTTPCEEQIEGVQVDFIEEQTVDFPVDTVVCFGDTMFLDISILGAEYQWSDGVDTSARYFLESGLYTVTIETACNTILEDIFVRNIDSMAMSPLLQDTFYCPGDILFLDASTATYASYLWSTGETSSKILVDESGDYTVRIYNECEDVYRNVDVKECEYCEVYIPNAFSPNSDGVNDVFRGYSECELHDYTLRIYSRWGALVYETNNINDGWDGDIGSGKLNTSVYVWEVEYSVIENNRPRKVHDTGTITLLK